jgi:hypothetical protein
MDGAMGTCPEYVALFQAAKWMNVAPWELAKQSIWWENKALIIMRAEYNAQKIIEQRYGRK